jgi:hypothetical protein
VAFVWWTATIIAVERIKHSSIISHHNIKAAALTLPQELPKMTLLAVVDMLASRASWAEFWVHRPKLHLPPGVLVVLVVRWHP